MLRSMRFTLALALLLGCGPVLAADRDDVQPPRGAPPVPVRPAGMVQIPPGIYQPQYLRLLRDPEGKLVPAPRQGVHLKAFYLDALPVTNAQFLAFVRARPLWLRSRVLRAFADSAYLARWSGELEPGPRAPAQAPVVEVSWFAASAYCAWRGSRLPSTAEWEYAARATDTTADGRLDPAFAQRVLDWYGRPTPAVLPPVGSVHRNAWGVQDLYGLVWEWTEDYAFRLDRGETANGTAPPTSFCGSGSLGAFDARDYAAFMRFAFRSSLRSEYTVGSLGFRCAASAH